MGSSLVVLFGRLNSKGSGFCRYVKESEHRLSGEPEGYSIRLRGAMGEEMVYGGKRGATMSIAGEKRGVTLESGSH